MAVAAAAREGAQGERAQPREDMTSRAEGERAGKRDRCVAPRADACSHFQTDTAAVYSPSAPIRGGMRREGRLQRLSPRATLTFRIRAPGAMPMICLR